ncbi:hypothetical protein CC78DRAFT_583589 [Lojkania enalia]|uniref:Chromo domain-containing protein n=1 Tax=Lojkania enalia TaxID=147567 RepID=A0A9P4K409_9PLEO|nr:hypothetical protein CC78DRAFT_583589 [Didymosphaeria enalia]
MLSRIKLSKANYIVEAVLDSIEDAEFGCRYLAKWEGYPNPCWELPTTISVTPQAIEFHET